MKIEHFRYLVTIDKLRSISAAAKQYNIRQNTLSTIVKQAEDEFGIHIFQRTPDGVICTAEGEQLMALAKEIDISYSQIMSIQKQVKGKASVNMVLDPVCCAVLAIPFAKCFNNSGSRGNLRFQEKEVKELILELCTDVYKLAVFRADAEMLELLERQKDKGFLSECLTEDELCVVVSRDHPLAAQPNVTAQQLQEHEVLWHQSMEDEICRLLGQETVDGMMRTMRHCDRHMWKSVATQSTAAVVSRFVLEHSPVWAQADVVILPLVETKNENRQKIMFCYHPYDLGRPRYQSMKECIEKWFANHTKGVGDL